MHHFSFLERRAKELNECVILGYVDKVSARSHLMELRRTFNKMCRRSKDVDTDTQVQSIVIETSFLNRFCNAVPKGSHWNRLFIAPLIRLYDALLEMSRHNVDILQRYLSFCIEHSLYKRFVRMAQRSCTLYPNNVDLYIFISQLFRQSQRLMESRLILLNAIENHPGHLSLWKELCSLESDASPGSYIQLTRFVLTEAERHLSVQDMDNLKDFIKH